MESRLLLTARVVLGVLLVLESLALLLGGALFGMIGGLVGMLAFGVSGGTATDAQLKQSFATLVIAIASPFFVAMVLLVGGVFLLIRKLAGVIVVAGVVAILAQIAFH